MQYPLIPQQQNNISYEHCVVQYLPPDIYIGDAERNYYISTNLEVNLCVHYNFRLPGKYAFIPEYRFYITKGRQSLSLHHSLGLIKDDLILESFGSLEEAHDSPYYQDFCQLKKQIDVEIQRQKSLQSNNSVHLLGNSSCSFKERDGKQIGLYEIFLQQTNEYVQFHTSESDKIRNLSVSEYSIMDIWRYLDDFYEIEPTELRLLSYLSVENDAISDKSPYHTAYKEMQRIKSLLDTPVGGSTESEV